MKLWITAALLASPLTDDWPGIAGPTGDRHTTETLEAKSLTEPEEVWRIETPGGFSSFAVAGPRAYTLVLRSGRECLVCLNAETGKERWAKVLGAADYDGGGGAGADGNKGGDGPRATPLVSGSSVYVYDANLVLWSFDQKTGQERWKVDVLKDHEGRQIRWQNASAPVIADGMVLIAGGGAGQTMMGIHACSGEIAWHHGDDTLTHATPAVAEFGGKTQVIYYLRKGLTSVDAKSGEVLWSVEYPFNVSSAASPVVSGDLVYVSAGYGVGAAVWRIHAKDDGFEPEFLWRKRNDLMNHWSTPVEKDGFLYGMFSFKEYGDGPLKCVEVETGEERWSTEGFGPGNVILAGDKIIALSDAGEVVLCDATPKEYNERGRAKLVEGKCWSSPTLAAGKLYVRSTTEGVAIEAN